MKKNYFCKVIWEVLILLMSSLILLTILLNFFAINNSNTESNTRHTKCKNCMREYYKENDDEGKNKAIACCLEPEFYLPYLFSKASTVGSMVLIITFWFFGIIFSKASVRLVQRFLNCSFNAKLK